MSCFILLTLAHVLLVREPPAQVYVNRAEIVTLRAALPPDPQRPSARSLLRLSGSAILHVTEPPAEVLRAPCAAR